MDYRWYTVGLITEWGGGDFDGYRKPGGTRLFLSKIYKSLAVVAVTEMAERELQGCVAVESVSPVHLTGLAIH